MLQFGLSPLAGGPLHTLRATRQLRYPLTQRLLCQLLLMLTTVGNVIDYVVTVLIVHISSCISIFKYSLTHLVFNTSSFFSIPSACDRMSAASNMTDIIGLDKKWQKSCSTCQDLAFRDETWSPFHTFREDCNSWEVRASFESLALSSLDGCPSCDLLCQFTKEMLKDNSLGTPELVTSKYMWIWEDSILSVEMTCGDNTIKRSFPLYVVQGKSARGKNRKGISCLVHSWMINTLISQVTNF